MGLRTSTNTRITHVLVYMHICILIHLYTCTPVYLYTGIPVCLYTCIRGWACVSLKFDHEAVKFQGNASPHTWKPGFFKKPGFCVWGQYWTFFFKVLKQCYYHKI